MDELTAHAAHAREDVRVDWSPARARAVFERIPARRAVRARRKAAAALAASVAAALLVGLVWRGTRRPAPAVAVDGAGALRFADGSLATPVDGRAELRAAEVTAARVVVRLGGEGGARFDIARDPSRVFRVEAGDVAVQVLGTAFSVERVAGRVQVEVSRGRVRVLWPSHAVELGAGERGVFPPTELAAAAPAPAPVPAPPSDEARVAAAQPSASSARAPSWRALAHGGRYAEAYAALERLGGSSAVRDEPGDLLLAADAARRSEHPAGAVAPLERLVVRHGRDPRAPSAAFTLGRVLLDELSRAREAAAAFGRARELDPRGVLAEDALAREVEAWSRAGDAARAAARAAEYVRRYPHGRRVGSVRRLGGIE